MEVIAFLGFLIFWGAIVYLFYHLIKKRKNNERLLPKKKFYSALIGGFLLFGIGNSLTDTSIQDELNEALDSNKVLTSENEKFNSTNKALKGANEKLKDENAEFTKEIEELTLKLADFDKFEQEILDEKQAHKESSEAFEKDIADLKSTNTSLASEVEGLKKQVASASTSSNAGTSTGTSSGGTSTPPAKTTTPAPAASGGSEWFQNCTELRKKYPSGVASDHPAYQSKMDRDKDGWACE